MVLPLAPVLANIIMTTLESTIIKNMFDTGKIKFYSLYADDTLLLIKPDNTQFVQDLFKNVHKNIHFTVDSFKNEVPHFLDIKMSAQGLTAFRKNMHTGQLFTVTALLREIIKLVGFVVLLQEPNVFVV